MSIEFKLQALKENVEIVEVNAIKVNVGDIVTKDQPLVEVQADKAALEVPSPAAGKITQILIKQGDQVKIGQLIFVIDPAGAGAAASPATPPTAPQNSAKPAPAPAPAAAVPVVATAAAKVAPIVLAHDDNKVIPAGPSTRRIARELGVDLGHVPGTGRHGRVSEDDVRSYVRGSGSNGSSGGSISVPPLPRFEDFGTVEKQPMSAIRRATARQMSLSWSIVPHVTQSDLSDITDFEAFRKSQTKGPKLTISAFAMKAVVVLLKEYPVFNSSIDVAGNQIIHKKFYNIGVAVDTENGLLVPVIRDVDKKSIAELAEELTSIAERARQRKLDSKDLTGGTFTITNLGGIGGTGFTPIVNYPEVAILGISRGRLEPVVHNGEIVPRLMMPLSLSYDHRVIDGAIAARFTRRLAEMLENPYQLLIHA
ncbi:MAG: biotin/lipoyl-binding protein [Planctomycetota bacterium]|jgi:pyruvate dehydrogenase E2 component (dihydrolipoamide acetyltransferase)|nr:MAG: biotin/lipoyl-binding protein [Planctomycetota bacterium]